MGAFSKRVAILAQAILLAVLLPSPSTAMNFETMQIGEPDWLTSFGWDASEQGVVGFYADSAGQRGFLYQDGVLTDISPPGWDGVMAMAISDDGKIAGVGSDGGVTKGFLYSGGSYTPIAPPGWTSLSFYGVNSSGQLAGFGDDGSIKGLLCNGSVCTPILPAGWSNANCYGINESGQLACSGHDGVTNKGFLYDGGTSTTIFPPGWASAQAFGINDSGQVVGTGNDGSMTSCFVYRNGAYTVIPPPPGTNTFVCRTIDQNGSVAGFTVDGMGTFGITVWSNGKYFTGSLPPGSFQFFPWGKMRNGLFTGYGIVPGPRAFTIRVTPAPDLKAGPFDGPGNVGPGAAFSITASLSAGIFKGAQGDYWLISQQPSGTWSYDARSQSWRPGIFPAAQGPLADFSGKKVFTTTGLPAGLHTFYLAVDMNMNGVPDAGEWHYDTLFFFVR